MKRRRVDPNQETPLLYCKTKEDIESYRKKSLTLKLQWLEAQIEFFHKAMLEKAKRMHHRLEKEEIQIDPSLSQENYNLMDVSLFSSSGRV